MDVVREIVLPTVERRPESTNGSLFFIGTATVLLRYAGFTILTDPNFLHKGEKVHKVMGSMLEFQTGGVTTFRMYITGDTLLFKQLKEIPKRFPDIDLALLHLDGVKVMGLMLTMDGQQGVRAMKMVSSRTAIPVHYNDYTAFKSPLEDFQKAVTAAGLSKRVKYLYAGDTYSFDTNDRPRR